MGRFIIKRLGQTLIVMFILSIFSFMLIHIMPGDPIYAMLGAEITDEMYQAAYFEMGFDKPLLVQYWSFISGVFQGDFGYSYYFRCDVVELIADRIPKTIYLGIISGIVSIILGVILGVISAVKRGTWIDNIITVIANLGISTPNFWLAVLLILFFGVKLGVLPIYGFTLPWEDFSLSIKQSIMPVICMAFAGMSSYVRQTRSSMLEVIRQDYIRTARSKGLREKVVIYKHALRNALIPILTLIGITLRNTIAGAAVIESVFNISGMGQLIVKCINGRDIFTIQAIILILAGLTCLCNMLVDIAYAYADPRIRLQ